MALSTAVFGLVMIFLHVVPFMGDCRIRISLPDDIPFSWLKVSLNGDLINKFTTEAKHYAYQHLNAVGLSPSS